MKTFAQLCEVEPRLESLRQEALEIANWSGGNMNTIRDLWHGKMNRPGVKAKMILLLQDKSVAEALQNRPAYHECYEGLWKTINSTRGVKD